MLNKAMEEYHQSLKNPNSRKASRTGAKAGHLFCLGGEGAESRVEVYHSNVNRWENQHVFGIRIYIFLAPGTDIV